MELNEVFCSSILTGFSFYTKYLPVIETLKINILLAAILTIAINNCNFNE